MEARTSVAKRFDGKWNVWLRVAPSIDYNGNWIVVSVHSKRKEAYLWAIQNQETLNEKVAL